MAAVAAVSVEVVADVDVGDNAGLESDEHFGVEAFFAVVDIGQVEAGFYTEVDLGSGKVDATEQGGSEQGGFEKHLHTLKNLVYCLLLIIIKCLTRFCLLVIKSSQSHN